MSAKPTLRIATTALIVLFVVSCGKSESRAALEQQVSAQALATAQSRDWPAPTAISDMCKAEASRYYAKNFAIREPFAVNPTLTAKFAEDMAKAIEDTPTLSSLFTEIVLYEVEFDTTGLLDGRGYSCVVLVQNDQPRALGIADTSGNGSRISFHTNRFLYEGFCAAGNKSIASSYFNSFKCV